MSASKYRTGTWVSSLVFFQRDLGLEFLLRTKAAIMRPLVLYRQAPRAFFRPQFFTLRSFNPPRNSHISTTSSCHYHHLTGKRILAPQPLSSTPRLIQTRTMSSATTFFEFEPVDSMYTCANSPSPHTCTPVLCSRSPSRGTWQALKKKQTN